MASFAICPIACAPVRSRPHHRSEMVTQLLFGEQVRILVEDGKWSKISCTWDGYTGWVSSMQLLGISEIETDSQQVARSLEFSQAAVAKDKFIHIPLGSRLQDFDGMRFQMGGEYYEFSGLGIDHRQIAPSPDMLIRIVSRYLYVPYLWGGRSPYGIDCSGFVQMVYLMLGQSLPRDASQQSQVGAFVDFRSEARLGDLAFFENRKGNITHVGIVWKDDQVVHASGHVRIDVLDQKGIYRIDQSKYTHSLRFIKRVLSDEFAPIP